MTQPTQLRIRGPLPPSQHSNTDLFITKDCSSTSVFRSAERSLRHFHSVTFRSTGAANYRALKLAIALSKSHPKQLTFSVTTHTIETTDFYLPLTSSSSSSVRDSRNRHLNGISILISLL
jgi:hypothetical protein